MAQQPPGAPGGVAGPVVVHDHGAVVADPRPLHRHLEHQRVGQRMAPARSGRRCQVQVQVDVRRSGKVSGQVVSVERSAQPVANIEQGRLEACPGGRRRDQGSVMARACQTATAPKRRVYHSDEPYGKGCGSIVLPDQTCPNFPLERCNRWVTPCPTRHSNLDRLGRDRQAWEISLVPISLQTAIRWPTPAAAATAVLLTAASLAAFGLSSAPATAVTTLTPTEPGTPPVVRDSTLNIKVDNVGITRSRLSPFGAYSATSRSTLALTIAAGGGCLGDNPAGTNLSPRTTVTVTGPGSAPGTVGTVTSPVRTPGSRYRRYRQPAACAQQFQLPRRLLRLPASASRTTVNLTGKPAGIYTVTRRPTQAKP